MCFAVLCVLSPLSIWPTIRTQIVQWVTPCLYGPSSPSPLAFWLAELNHSLVPWIVLPALAYPVPLKVGAWHCGTPYVAAELHRYAAMTPLLPRALP